MMFDPLEMDISKSFFQDRMETIHIFATTLPFEDFWSFLGPISDKYGNRQNVKLLYF